MKNIVIDCNVYVAAFIGSEICFKALDKAFSNYGVCYSEATLKELLDVIKRPKFKYILNSKRIETTLQLLYSCGELLDPKSCKIELPDPNDTIYLDLAIAANAECIITGNKKHFPEKLCLNIKILSPGGFVK